MSETELTIEKCGAINPGSLAEGEIIESTTRCSLATVPIHSLSDMEKIAQWMTLSQLMPVHLRWPDNPQVEMARALMIVSRAAQLRIDPMALAHECYVVNGKMGLTGVAIAAIINARAGLAGPLEHCFWKEGNFLRCKVWGRFKGKKGSVEKTLYEEKVKSRSQGWDRDPENQLYYATVRAWARLHAPGLMVGVVSVDEIEDGGYAVGDSVPEASTPSTPAPAPTAAVEGKPVCREPVDIKANTLQEALAEEAEKFDQKPVNLDPAAAIDFFLAKELYAEFDLFFTQKGIGSDHQGLATRSAQRDKILQKRGVGSVEAMTNAQGKELLLRLRELTSQPLGRDAQGVGGSAATDTSGSATSAPHQFHQNNGIAL